MGYLTRADKGKWFLSYFRMYFEVNLRQLGSAKCGLRAFATALAQLNNAFPEFSIDSLAEFCTQHDVQQPLRSAFSYYMEAQLDVLRLLGSNTECAYSPNTQSSSVN
jgi:hypothetical protein